MGFLTGRNGSHFSGKYVPLGSCAFIEKAFSLKTIVVTYNISSFCHPRFFFFSYDIHVYHTNQTALASKMIYVWQQLVTRRQEMEINR